MKSHQPTPIHLPPPSKSGTMSLEEAIARRKSLRRFASEPVSQTQLSQILWAAQGNTDRRRTVPSAGATYPLELFVACGANGVEGLSEGVYHYNYSGHYLSLHSEGDARMELAGAALGQEFMYRAPVDIIVCAIFQRTALRYGDRAERYVHFEVGHAGQNIYLQATALGLATVAVGAFYDEQVSAALRLDRQYEPLYIMPLGKPA